MTGPAPTDSTKHTLAGASGDPAEPGRCRVGQRVGALGTRGRIDTHPVMTVAQIDPEAGKAQIRYTRPDKEMYSYLFWCDLSDLIPLEEEASHGDPATASAESPEVRTRYDPETDA